MTNMWFLTYFFLKNPDNSQVLDNASLSQILNNKIMRKIWRFPALFWNNLVPFLLAWLSSAVGRAPES